MLQTPIKPESPGLSVMKTSYIKAPSNFNTGLWSAGSIKACSAHIKYVCLRLAACVAPASRKESNLYHGGIEPGKQSPRVKKKKKKGGLCDFLCFTAAMRHRYCQVNKQGKHTHARSHARPRTPSSAGGTDTMSHRIKQRKQK